MSQYPTLITPGFEKYAKCLNRLVFSESARCVYEVMSGALLWEDEKPDIPFSEIGWFRAALAYRSSVILGQPRTEFEPIWSALLKIAPRWPGFRIERCTPTPELIAYLSEHKRSSMRSFARWEAALSKRWKPLSGKRRDV